LKISPGTLADLFLQSAHMMVLKSTDLAIIALYFVLVLGLGVYLRQFAGTNNDFFMAGREMTAGFAGLSFISANLGSVEMMGYAAATYQYGIVIAHAYWIAAIPAILFLAPVMSQLHLQLWWGGVLLILGLVNVIRFWPREGRN
jgi:SSS family solute:Na+ symporter